MPKPRLTTKVDTVRNRYAYTSTYVAGEASAPQPILPPPWMQYVPGTKVGLQKSIGGVGDFADFRKTYVTRIHRGSSTPNWRRQRDSKGGLVNTLSVDDWSITDHSMQACVFEYNSLGKTGNSTGFKERLTLDGGSVIPCEFPNSQSYNMTLPSSLRWGTSVLDDLAAVAHNDFLVKCSTEAEFELAIFLGEFNETRKMLETTTVNILEGVRSFQELLRRMRNSGATVSAIRSLAAKKYLEFQFGWLQLYRDLKQINKLLRQYESQDPKTLKRINVYKLDLAPQPDSVKTRRSRGEARPEPKVDEWKTYYDSGFRSVKVIDGPLTDVYAWRRDREVGYKFCTISGAISPEVYNFSTPTLAKWGLSPSDAASVAWELTRLSWIVDAFIPVGDFLAADWDLAARVKWASRTRGYVVQGQTDLSFNLDNGVNPYLELVSGPSTARTTIRNKRIERDDYYPHVGETVHFTLKSPGSQQVKNIIAYLLT